MLGESLFIAGFRLGDAYSRKEIAAAGQVEPPTGPRDPHWGTGIVRFDNCTVLLVTLEKDEGYQDYFEGSQFWWQSQNRQTKESPDLQAMASGARPAILFVREVAKASSVTQPFVYCGRLSAPEMEGERPVTCLFDSLDYVDGAEGALGRVYGWTPSGAGNEPQPERKLRIRTRKAAGQGRQLDAASRKALELHGMRVAVGHYESLGYTVRDTSARHPWDLEVARGPEFRRVEVKATQSMGHEVILTVGEVRAAQEPGIVSDLFIVFDLFLQQSAGAPVVTGGSVRLVSDWRPLDRDLCPTEYRYRVPS